LGEHSKTGRFAMKKKLKFLVVYEDAGTNYSAYVPDLPGCVSTGATREEVARNIREAISFHLEGMREDDDPIPERYAMWAEVVEIDEPEPAKTAS
jgi:predicted RNase H-like HicB family nuclease